MSHKNVELSFSRGFHKILNITEPKGGGVQKETKKFQNNYNKAVLIKFKQLSDFFSYPCLYNNFLNDWFKNLPIDNPFVLPSAMRFGSINNVILANQKAETLVFR